MHAPVARGASQSGDAGGGKASENATQAGTGAKYGRSFQAFNHDEEVPAISGNGRCGRRVALL
jgi:hypothetical protein